MPTAATATSPQAVSGGRPQPQTTVEAGPGPFIRFSQPGARAMYNVSGQPFGATVAPPLVSAPGYAARFRATISASGGTSTTAVVAAPDAPFNAIQQVRLVDPFGTPLLVGPGYEMLKLVPKYSGQFGLLGAADITNLPSYSPVSLAAAAGAGDFSFSTSLSLELSKGYGLLSMANSAELPQLSWTLAGSGQVYTTAPTTLPTLGVEVDTDFYWLPAGNANIVPPALGTTQQWFYAQANPTIASGSTATVQFPRGGGYISTIILIMRDSTGARIDAWPQRIRLYVDGVQIVDRSLSQVEDDMYNQFGGVTRETGVLAFTRKTSLSQLSLGLLDDLETYLSTNPGTLLEIQGAPWGAIANAPAQLSVVMGQVVPAGHLVTGLPEV